MAITTQPGASSTDLTTLLGTELADTFKLVADNLYIDGLAGSDTVTAAGALDKITIKSAGDADRLTFSGELANSNVDLGIGNDVFGAQNLENVTITAGQGVDSLTVARAALTTDIKGRSGNDVITFSTTLGSSYIGGDKDDDSITVTGATSSSTIRGGNQNDTIKVAALTSTTVRGDNNNDRIDVSGSLKNSFVNGNDGNDSITLSAAVTSATGSKVFGGKGIDTIVINATTALEINGGADKDDITTSTNNKFTVLGGSGNDLITHTVGGTKAVSLLGGDGNDSIDIAGGNTANNVISGEAGKDTMVGIGGADTLDGGAGDDNITTGAGNDVVYGRAGKDSVTINGTGNKKVLGGADNDTFTFSSPLGKNDTIKGETGTDAIEYYLDDLADADFTNVTSVSTLNGNGTVLNATALTNTLGAFAQAAGLVTLNFGDVVGTNGGGDDDLVVNASAFTSAVGLTITGSNDANVSDGLTGGGGADTISSGTSGNADSLTGGAGNDLFNIVSGVITAIQDLNNGDNFTISADAAGVAHTAAVITDFTAGLATSNLGAAADAVLTANGGVDVINMAGVSASSTGGFTINGNGNTASTMTGSGQDDIFTTGTGVDSITGGAGGDTINGGGGADVLLLGDGNDETQNTVAGLHTIATTITGGSGTDTISITDLQAPLTLTAAAITGVEALIFDTADGDNAADATTIDAGMFSTGAATFTITGGANAEADTLVITKKTTNFETNAETTIGAVDAVGEWFFDANVGGNGVFTYFNEETSGVTNLTLTGTGWAMSSPGATITATL